MPKAPAAAPSGKPKRPRKPKITALVTLPQTRSKKRSAGQRVPRGTRLLFLKAFEENFGNVSVACQVAKIHRRTFYRWMDSSSRVNKKFQERIAQIRPDEKLVDAAEYTITNGMAKGDITAAIFTAKTKGRNRGWSEKPADTATLDADAITKLLDAFQSVLKENPAMSEAERSMWIKDFADSGGVPEETLARKIRVLELTGGK